MDERFATFETLTLPSLKAQTDPDFTLAIVVGEAIPKARLARLLDLVEAMPQVIIIPRAPGRHRQIMRAPNTPTTTAPPNSVRAG